MSEHSRLFAPSAFGRTVHCTASAEAATRYDDPPGEETMRGTAFHWLKEQCLTNGYEPSMFLGRIVIVRQENVERRFVVTRDMAVDAKMAVDWVREVARTPGESHVEAKIDLAHFHPDCFGRCDLWHLGDDGVLIVEDDKYGRVDVPVLYPDGHLNWQMVLYTLGIIEELSKRLHPIRMPHSVRLVIIQPRSIQPGPRIKHHTVDVAKILALEAVVRRAIQEVLEKPTFRQGDWCQYCPALGSCPETQQESRALAPILAGIGDMTALDAGRILLRKDLLAKIVKEAERVARDNLMRGVPVPGFKLVTGVKHRQWTDEDAVADAVGGIGGAFQVVSPAQMEKLPGGKDVVAKWAAIPPGDPVVAPASDKRAPYVARSASEMFGAPS